MTLINLHAIRAHRTAENPIIHPDLDPSLGQNINGPSLIRVPDWLPNPLGKYYLYFGHHKGEFIRLAYADNLIGPWRIHQPGTLRLEQTACARHIASPDVHIDDENRQIIMYFHGPSPTEPRQVTHRATSKDGLNFTADDVILGPPYMRIFQIDEEFFALGLHRRTLNGEVTLVNSIFRSPDGISPFEMGDCFIPLARHSAVWRRGESLVAFFSRYGDTPEHIMMAHIDLRGDWLDWQASQPVSLLQPETDYEGANLLLAASVMGLATEPVRQLRDPAIFEEAGRVWLLYSVAGENGIGLAELTGISD